MRPTFICDIDGTLANLTHRLPFIKTEPKNWDAFFAACGGDAPITPVINTVKYLFASGATVVYSTGRTESTRIKTLDWLRAQGLPDGLLFMRTIGDHRPDNIVKAELLEAIQALLPTAHILGVFEDRKQVVDMYRDRGLVVFQVADGNF